MQPADMNENRCNESPPLAFSDCTIGFHAECHQRRLVAASAGERHKKKYRDVETEEDVGVRRAAGPHGLKKLEVIFGNHFRWRQAQKATKRPALFEGLS